MLISLKHGFAFLCLPKCGSTSVENALKRHSEITFSRDPALKHMTARQFHRHIQPLLQKLAPDAPAVETFCIIREPIERVQSWYAYQTRAQISNPSHPSHGSYTGNITFAEFVEACLASDRPTYAKVGSAYDFIRLADGSIGVDRLFRLDNMEAVSTYLSEKTGSTIEIPHHNASPGRTVVKHRSALSRVKRALRGKFSEPPPAKISFDLPDPLRARLRVFLAEDYRIYESLAVK